MPFTLPQLVSCRPFLYHLTASTNLPGIAESLRLQCANSLLAEAGRIHQSSVRRLHHLPVLRNGRTTHLRDQTPLIEGAIEFEDGWDLARFVHHANQHVFFWPGRNSGPIGPGLNHFERYRAEAPAILRLPTTALLETTLNFSRYNSGAPRCSGGKYSPRGARTYLPASKFVGTASEVVEVVAIGACSLPSSVEVSHSPTGPWRPLLSAA
jgi:hypothetical protein